MKSYLKTADSEWYKTRVTWVAFSVVAVFVALFVRLFYLQIMRGEELRRLSVNNSIRLQIMDPPRGFIFDRNGALMVENRPSFDLSVLRKAAKPLKTTIEKLSTCVEISVADLKQTLKKNGRGIAVSKPILLKQDIGRDTLARVEVHKFELPGILVDVKRLRNYIFPHRAAHLIGYLNEISPDELQESQYAHYRQGDYIGKYGVEKAYEKYLQGKQGGRQVEVDVAGVVVRVLETVEAQPGKNVYLTIDFDLQQKAEQLLAGKTGAVVAVDPRNGEVLAMASSPAFDQNAFIGGLSHDQWRALSSNAGRPLRNKAIQGEYPPASTYKIVTALAGLEEGVINEKTVLRCPGFYKFGRREYRCWRKGGHGAVDIYRAITESCDVYFYQVGLRLGIDRIAFYGKACGLGSATGIELDKESKGLAPTAAWKKNRYGIAWQEGETLSVAIGQGFNLATPLQMAMLIAAVANNGLRYKPQVVQKVLTRAGTVIHHNAPRKVGKLPVRAKNLRIVQKGLWLVVNGDRGTARRSRLEDIEMCGKTGTAQVVGRKSDDDDMKNLPDHLKDHGWFVAYAPSDTPRIAIAVLVEHGEHGSSVAPIAKEMVKTYLGTADSATGIQAKQGAGNAGRDEMNSGNSVPMGTN